MNLSSRYWVPVLMCLVACKTTSTPPVDAGGSPGDSAIASDGAASDGAGTDVGASPDASEVFDAGHDPDATVALDGGLEDSSIERPDAAVGSWSGRTIEGGSICDEMDVGRLRGEVTLMPGCSLQVAADGLVVEGTLTGGLDSEIVVPLGMPGLFVGPDARIEDVTVNSNGIFAVALIESENADVDGLTITAERGVGLYIRDTTDATLDDVQVRGPVTELNANEPRWLRVQGAPSEPRTCADCECNPGEFNEADDLVCTPDGEWVTWAAPIGVYVEDSTVTLGSISSSGFAGYGLAFVGSFVTASSIGTVTNVGVGIAAQNSTIESPIVGADNSYDGVAPGVSALLTSGTSVRSSGFCSFGGSAYGLIADESSLDCSTPTISGNQKVSAWATGAGASIRLTSGNVNSPGTGMVITHGAEVQLENVNVGQACCNLEPLKGGLRMINPSASSTIRNSRFLYHSDVGILLGLENALSPRPTFMSVTIPFPDGYAALIGIANPTTGMIEIAGPTDWTGWDTGIMRDATGIANDASPPATIAYDAAALPDGISAIVGPMFVIGPMFIVGPMY